jgi:cyclophilin family peptidyl-prolyl cis-trans isomerase
MLRHSLRRLAPAAPSYSNTVKAWMEFSVADAADPDAAAFAAPRRVEFELYGKKCPMAVENFARLCLGDMVLPVQSPSEAIAEPSFKDQYLPQLTYHGSPLHRAVPGYLVQGGDVSGRNGHSGMTVFGAEFDAPDELGALPFTKGMVGTAVSAPHKNTSQFFVLLADAAPHLDGTCVCFGKVTKGLDVFADVAALPRNHADRPRVTVSVSDSGLY